MAYDSLLSTKEAAEYVHRDERTIRRWVEKGAVRAQKENGVYRIAKKDLDAAVVDKLDQFRGHQQRAQSSNDSDQEKRIKSASVGTSADMPGGRPEGVPADDARSRLVIAEKELIKAEVRTEDLRERNKYLEDERREYLLELGRSQAKLANAREQLALLQAPEEPEPEPDNQADSEAQTPPQASQQRAEERTPARRLPADEEGGGGSVHVEDSPKNRAQSPTSNQSAGASADTAGGQSRTPARSDDRVSAPSADPLSSTKKPFWWPFSRKPKPQR